MVFCVSFGSFLKIISQKSKPENQWFWELYVMTFEGQDILNVSRQIVGFKRLISDKAEDNSKETALKVPIEMLCRQKLKRSGRSLVGLCPLHNEKTPSFYIYHDNRFYCYGCQKNGDVIDFVRELYHISFKTAVKLLIKIK